MVAEAALVAVAVEGAEGLDAAVFLVFFKEEGGVVDVGLLDTVEQYRTDEDVVDAAPAALIAVSALHAF